MDRDCMSSLRCIGVCYNHPSVGCLGNEMMHGRTRQAPPALGQSRAWANQGNLYAEVRILDVPPGHGLTNISSSS